MTDSPISNSAVQVVASQTAAESGVTEKDIQMIGTIISSFAQPMARAQETAAVETTKQTQIIADATQRSYRWFFIIVLGVLILAGVALFKDKDQITEKLIIAMFSFLGGLGLGRTAKK